MSRSPVETAPTWASGAGSSPLPGRICAQFGQVPPRVVDDLACDGEEVLAKIADRDYDVILMDCHMPRLDGYAATKEIRLREGKLRHTAIVALTASAMKEDRELAMLAGMDDFLSKPVRKDELAAKLARWAQLPSSKNIDNTSLSVPNSNALEPPISIAPIPKLSIDLEYLHQISEGDPEFERKILQVFVENTQEQLRSIHIALANRDLAKIEQILHTIKGASANVGAVAIEQLTVQLDKMLSIDTFDSQNLSAQTNIYPLLHEIEYLTQAISQMHEPQVHLG